MGSATMFEPITSPMMLPVVVPLLAGLVCLLIPRAAASLRPLLAVLAAAATLALAAPLAWPLLGADPGAGSAVSAGLPTALVGATFEPAPWLSLRLDGLSAFILLGVAFFGLLIAVFSVGYFKGRERQREYYA